MAASMVVRLVAQKERSLAFLTAVRKAPLLAARSEPLKAERTVCWKADHLVALTVGLTERLKVAPTDIAMAVRMVDQLAVHLDSC